MRLFLRTGRSRIFYVLFAIIFLSLSFSKVCAFETFHLKGGAIHENISSSALLPLGISETSFKIIDAGNTSQDIIETEKFADSSHHFDDCQLASAYAYVQQRQRFIIDQAGSAHKNQQALENCLYAFGELLHTVQDFYSHTNYVELHLKKDVALAPLDIPLADWNALASGAPQPAGLKSGYFYYRIVIINEKFVSRETSYQHFMSKDKSLKFLATPEFESRTSSFAGYILYAAEPGLSALHYDINKDSPTTVAGSKVAPAAGKSLFDYAFSLAARESARQWQDIERAIRKRYPADAKKIIQSLKIGKVWEAKEFSVHIESDKAGYYPDESIAGTAWARGGQPPYESFGKKIEVSEASQDTVSFRWESALSGMIKEEEIGKMKKFALAVYDAAGKKVISNTIEVMILPRDSAGERKISLVSAQVSPEEGTIKDKYVFKLTYRVENILPGELPSGESNLRVTGPLTLPFSDKPIAIAPAMIRDGTAVLSTEASARFAKAGDYAWNYAVEISDYPLLQGSSPFRIKEKEPGAEEETGVPSQAQGFPNVFGTASEEPQAQGEAGVSLQAKPSGPFYVFLLTNASYGLYLGTEDSLKGIEKCSFEGGGINCKPTDVITYDKLLGPFKTESEAEAALCTNVTERYVYPLGIGLKGQWQGDDKKWYGLWDASVKFDCKEIPHQKFSSAGRGAQEARQESQAAEKSGWKITAKAVEGDDVEYSPDAGKTWQRLGFGAELKEGYRLRTGYQCKVTLLLPNNDTVVIEELTEFGVNIFRMGSTNEIELWLKAGEVQAKVHRAAGIRTEFRATVGYGGGAVRGTQFRAAVRDNAAEFLVSEGEVLVSHYSTNKQVLLRAGEKIRLSVEGMDSAQPMSAEERKKQGMADSSAQGVAAAPSSKEDLLKSPSPWKHSKVQEIIDTWLKAAIPAVQLAQGGNWFYDEWGRAYDNVNVKKPTMRPDTAMDRYEYLWSVSRQLDSVSHLTLREYVEKTLAGETITGRRSAKAAVVIPEPAPGTPTGAGTGQAAPLFQAVDVNGQAFDLSKLRSKGVVLCFWGGSNDPNTRKALSALAQLGNQYGREYLETVSVSLYEGADQMKSLANQAGGSFIQISDTQGKIAAPYELDVSPKVFVIDPRGVVQFVGRGSDAFASADFQKAAGNAAQEAQRYRSGAP